MTTSSTNEVRHWSDFLRFFALGPVALGMSACVNPAARHATWLAMRARRHAAQPQARDEGTARRTQR
jgi:hypothetical protein